MHNNAEKIALIENWSQDLLQEAFGSNFKHYYKGVLLKLFYLIVNVSFFVDFYEAQLF